MNIIGRRRLWFVISLLIIIPGTYSLLRWGLKAGIEFTGGQVMEVTCTEPVPFAVVISFERMKYPARGRNGGQPGAIGRLYLDGGEALAGKGYH